MDRTQKVKDKALEVADRENQWRIDWLKTKVFLAYKARLFPNT
ncbi:hypothetical protein [Lysinibacillus cavernae]|nr:hypothetical protein [Lysinibacillus cavernae]